MALKSWLLIGLVVVALIFLINREEPDPGSGTAVAGRPEGPGEVTWGTLRGLDPKTGVAKPEVKALEGKIARVAGYLVPLDDDARELSEFLLVPYQGACVHTPPPPANQMIYVKMTRGERIRFGLMDAVWVEGTLFLGRRSSPYGPVQYSMTARRVDHYR
jgi:hypothetical protein